MPLPLIMGTSEPPTMRNCTECRLIYDDNAPGVCPVDGQALTPGVVGSRVLAERYRLEERMAQGAMGVVLRATHLLVGSTVAVKLMRPQDAELKIAMARFRREAEILGKVKHPNAVLVMDFGVEDRSFGPLPYLVTEFLRGEPLSRRIRGKKQLPLPEVVALISPLCEAVEEAHQVGVVHRDIKPSNVFLEKLRDGTEIVKVLDFGVAQFVHRSPQEESADDAPPQEQDWEDRQATDPDRDVTQVQENEASFSGCMVGTIPYMAPEQFGGERVSGKADVYAIASMIFRLLSGRLPFSGSQLAVISQKMRGIQPSLRNLGIDVPERLDECLRQAFHLEPKHRPGVLELAAEVRFYGRQRAPIRADHANSEVVLSALTDIASKLTDLKTKLQAVDSNVRDESDYIFVRDRIITLDRPLLQLTHQLLSRETTPFEAEEAALLAEKAEALKTASDQATRALTGLVGNSSRQAEFLQYLEALALRLKASTRNLDRILGQLLRGHRGPKALAPGAALFDAPELGAQAATLLDISDGLHAKDPLDRIDALDELHSHHRDAVIAHLARPETEKSVLTRQLLLGLWQHADLILVRELYPRDRQSPPILPRLANLHHAPEAKPFRVLASIFQRARSSTPREAFLFAQTQVDPLEADTRRGLWRCLLLHPVPQIREVALRKLNYSDFWNVVAHPRSPLALTQLIFERVRNNAPREYLKVFFLCVHDKVLACQNQKQLLDACLLVKACFQVACFHEHLVFDRLVELEQNLRKRCQARGIEPFEIEAYEARLQAFLKDGPVEDQPPDNMQHVPLPVQRKMASQGHFLSYFVSHANERVARETLPHLLALRDVTPFLKIRTINRVVLVELTKNRKFFLKGEARVALLHNPKTPGTVARKHIPYVTAERLRLLVNDKRANSEVRKLAQDYLDRMAHRGRSA